MPNATVDLSELGNASTASLSSTRGGEPPGIEKAALGGAADSNTQVAAGEAVRDNGTTDDTDSVEGAPSTSDADDDVTPDEALYEVECEASAGITERLPLPRALDTVAGKYYAAPVATINRVVCDHYLREDNLPHLRAMSAEMVKDGLLGLINETIATENMNINVKEPVHSTLLGAKRVPITRLSVVETSRLMRALHTIISITPSLKGAPDGDELALYNDDPASPAYGTYQASLALIENLATEYCPDLATKEFIELLAKLRTQVRRRVAFTNRDLVAVNNGVVDYNGGRPVLMPFSPEYIFTSKVATNFIPDAQDTPIPNPEGCVNELHKRVCGAGHTTTTNCDDDCGPVPECDDECLTWTAESWMRSLAVYKAEGNDGEVIDKVDEDVTELLWEITGAVVRPYVSWNKAAFFYSEQGNNGKGTLVGLHRNLLGEDNYCTIPMSDFGREYMLTHLLRAHAILVDENDVGTYIDKAANFKAIVTNDVIAINSKYKDPINHRHYGFMIQCLNDAPRIRDKSESFYRRQTFVPFRNCFTGAERKYIKDDYLTRPAVLEYVLKRVLTMNYYSLSEPEACKNALDEFKELNDPVRAFWEEFRTLFVWDLLPFQFLYDLFLAWMARNMSASKPQGRNTFIKDLLALVRTDPGCGWACNNQKARITSGSRMKAHELLSVEYDLEDWLNPKATKTATPAVKAAFTPKRVYSGLVRTTAQIDSEVMGR